MRRRRNGTAGGFFTAIALTAAAVGGYMLWNRRTKGFVIPEGYKRVYAGEVVSGDGVVTPYDIYHNASTGDFAWYTSDPDNAYNYAWSEGFESQEAADADFLSQWSS